MNLRDWLYSNITNRFILYAGFDWNLVFGITAWFLWQWRNQLTFSHQDISLDSVIHTIKRRCQEICNAEVSCVNLPSDMITC